MTLTPSNDGAAAQVVFTIDGKHRGYGDIDRYELPSPAFFGFTARTGGATNNHWVRSVAISQPSDSIDVPPDSTGCSLPELGIITEDSCPASPDGEITPTTCPPGCAARIMPWFEKCRRDPEFLALDRSVQQALLHYRKLCSRAGGGGH